MWDKSPVQHSFVREVEEIFAGNRMGGDIASDGKHVFSMFQFTNIVNEKTINDPYGQRTVARLLQDGAPHKAFLESLGIYKMRNTRGSDTPGMTFIGLKGLLSKLPGKVADKYTAYCTEITTRVEAGDSSMHNVIDDNAASSNMYNAMARDALAHERAAGGIAAPPDQVLAAHMVCFCCT